MAVPKKKSTKSSRRERASHFALKKTKLLSCPKCKKPVLPHHLCAHCGYYKGKEIVEIKTKGKKEKNKK